MNKIITIPWIAEIEKARTATARLEYLRRELRAGRMSYAELAELQSLVEYIEPGDVELLEAAGAPEFEVEEDKRFPFWIR